MNEQNQALKEWEEVSCLTLLERICLKYVPCWQSNCCVRTNWKMNREYVLNRHVELETSELMFNQQVLI